MDVCWVGRLLIIRLVEKSLSLEGKFCDSELSLAPRQWKENHSNLSVLKDAEVSALLQTTWWDIKVKSKLHRWHVTEIIGPSFLTCEVKRWVTFGESMMVQNAYSGVRKRKVFNFIFLEDGNNSPFYPGIETVSTNPLYTWIANLMYIVCTRTSYRITKHTDALRLDPLWICYVLTSYVVLCTVKAAYSMCQ